MATPRRPAGAGRGPGRPAARTTGAARPAASSAGGRLSARAAEIARAADPAKRSTQSAAKPNQKTPAGSRAADDSFFDEPGTAGAKTPGSGRAGRGVLSFADGWARRAGAAQRRRSIQVWWVVGGLGALLALAWVLLWSPLLAVSTIEVSGGSAAVRTVAERVGAEQKGRSMVLLDTSAVEAQIEADSRVADATVRRGMPRSLVIEVIARVPVLGLEKSQGQVDLLDIEGVRTQTVKAAPSGVPVVKGGSGVGDEESVRAALAVMAALPEATRAKVTNLQFDAADSVSFRLGSTAVVWGSSERSELKAQLVGILLSQKPKTIDVSAPDNPVTR